MRNISGLMTFDKILEKLLAELILSDMGKKMDPSQYGNQKGIGIQHYLVKMVDKILSALDKNSSNKNSAVLASIVDWDNAFPRVCPKLGIQSFIKNGVRPSVIPLLVNYFQNRKMSVKWHDCFSDPIQINGGGPQGATLGILVYLSLSNSCSEFLEADNKFRFIDDLTVLEVIDLLSLKVKKFDIENSVPNDIPTHNNVVEPKDLKTQEILNKLSKWT